MKKNSTSFLVLALSLCFPFVTFALTDTSANDPTKVVDSTSSQSVNFSDVPQTNVNYVAIMYWKKIGVLSGYSDGTFKPDALVSRAEAVKILLAGNQVELPENVATVSFSDVKVSDWFAKYLEVAKQLQIIGGNPDGTFAPARNVSRAEFLKMILTLNTFKTDKWIGQQMFADVPKDVWYTPYMNYGGQAGLLTKSDDNKVFPEKSLTRGEVAQISYLLLLIRKAQDTQFLISQSESQMAQIEDYISDNDLVSAARSAQLAIDLTQQAYTNLPTNNVVLGAAKLAKAYGLLVNSYMQGLQKHFPEAEDLANQAIAKATEAWDVNHDLQPIAKHIKDAANIIISQIPKS